MKCFPTTVITIGHFGFVLWIKQGKENNVIIVRSLFTKCFLSTPKERKAGVFKFLRFEEHFRKAPVSRGISVDSGPNQRKKAEFSNSFRIGGEIRDTNTLNLSRNIVSLQVFVDVSRFSPCVINLTGNKNICCGLKKCGALIG